MVKVKAICQLEIFSKVNSKAFDIYSQIGQESSEISAIKPTVGVVHSADIKFGDLVANAD